MTKSKIVYIVPVIYPCSTGGLEIFYYKLLPEIAKTEKLVLISACNHPLSNVNLVKIPKNIFGLRGTTTITVLLMTFIQIFKLRKQIKIVHLPYTSNSGKWGFVLPFLKILFNVDYLLHIHGGGMRKWKPFSGNKMLFKYASQICGVSDVIKKEYENRSNRKIDVVLPLVPFDTVSEDKMSIRNHLKINENDCVILFVGSLKPLKRPLDIIDAISLISKEWLIENKVKFIFIGGGSLVEDINERIVENNLSEFVHLTGKISYDDVPPYYKASDIYIISSDYEGTPKAMLEAMHHHLPIIASDVNGINNILTNNTNALLFPKANPEEMSRVIKKLVEDRELRKELSQNAYSIYSEKFIFENTVQQLLKKYNQ